MQTKVCTKCGKERLLKEFNSDKRITSHAAMSSKIVDQTKLRVRVLKDFFNN